jgi:hypothetical protein
MDVRDKFERARAFFGRLGVALPIFVGALVIPGMFLGFAGWIVYGLIAPLFRPDPLKQYLEIAMFVGGIALFIGLLVGAIRVVGYLYSRFKVVRMIVSAMGILLALAIATGGILQMFSGNAPECRTGRYSDC